MTAPRLSHLATGLAGAALVLLVELVSLGHPGPSLCAAVAGLFAGLGLAIGLALLAGDLLARQTGRPPIRALVRAAPALCALIPLSRHLFDGGFAATLPGARAGRFWVPAAGWLLLASFIWVSGRIARPRLTAAASAGSAAACLLVDRRLYPRGYADLHLLLAIAACVAAGLALQGALNRGAEAPRSSPRRAVPLALAIAALLAVDLRYGLSRAADRWTVALHWTTTRRLVKAARATLDRDGDGYGALLGGPDCDDGDARIHPLAVEVPGNAVDEDCDGVAAQAGPPPLEAPHRAPPGAVAVRAGADVIVLCVDGLRADLLADTPEDRRDFPHLFQLTDGSRRFRRAFASSSSTYISLPGMLSGRFDPFRLEPRGRTLAEVMRDSGRKTHAVLPREVVRWVGELAATRGLDGWDATSGGSGANGHGDATTSGTAVALGRAFLDAHPAPAYLWLHLFDVHEHNEIADSDPALAEITGGARLDRRAKYRALLGVVDRAVGRFADGLGARWQRAIVVLVADHGEGLGGDPRLPDEHNEYVYEPLVRVPLAIRVPGGAPGDQDEPVSIVDLLPTLAELVGRPIPDGTDGASLAQALSGGAMPAPRPLWMSDAEQYALVDWPWKLLVRPQDNLRELYDLSRDPGERDDRSGARPDLVARLNQVYRLREPFRVDQSARARREREAAQAAQLGGP